MNLDSPAPSHCDQPLRVGVSGTGFIASGLLTALANEDLFSIGRVLTRRIPDSIENIDLDLLTCSVEEFVDSCDIVVDCSGDVVHTAQVVSQAFAAGRPVVTMGTEFHITIGSYFADRGYLTEAEGDQPGTLAAHAEDVESMGFKPIVYGNIKGFLNHHPLSAEMEYWSRKNGISIEQTISFTDGSKLQMEQALVANGLGATLAKRGMLGVETLPLEVAGTDLGRIAKTLGSPISDYVLNRNLPAGVFVVAEHPFEKPEVLRYLKLGHGPFYTLLRPYHLCHLEILKTLRRVAAGRPPLLNNSTRPTVAAVAVVKRSIPAGQIVERSFGGYDLRAEAVLIREAPHAVPVGLLSGAVLTRSVEPGETLTWDDVEIPESLAFEAGLALRDLNSTVSQA